MIIRPILFNTEMTRAILDGRKTCTRRKIDKDISNKFDVDSDGTVVAYIDQATGDRHRVESMCKYQQGDILYVRETWCKGSWMNEKERYYYKADDNDFLCTWHPSIHMPKEAARIWLKVTDVRVERLQEITEDGAKAEGAIDNRGFIHSPENEYDRIHTARENFIEIWDRTIKKSDLDLYGWDANPWVWEIEFERCEKPKEGHE